MSQDNFRHRRQYNALSMALIGNFTNIIIIMVLKTISNFMGNNGTYNTIYGIIQLVVISLFWIIFNWLGFKNAANQEKKSYRKYLMYVMLPMVIVTILTVVMAFVGGDNFNLIWNQLSLVIAPALFLYLPYGIVYVIGGKILTIFGFMAAMIVYILLMQCIGYLMGAQNRAAILERDKKRSDIEKQYNAKQIELARQAESRMLAQKQTAQRAQRAAMRQNANIATPTPLNENDPLSDVEQPAILKTESFVPITEDMIEEALRLNKIRMQQAEDIKKAKQQFQQAQQSKMMSPQQVMSQQQPMPPQQATPQQQPMSQQQQNPRTRG